MLIFFLAWKKTIVAMFSFLFIDLRGREGEREREVSTCFSTHLCIHWLILACALTRDWTCNLGTSECCSNHLSCPARIWSYVLEVSYFPSKDVFKIQELQSLTIWVLTLCFLWNVHLCLMPIFLLSCFTYWFVGVFIYLLSVCSLSFHLL